MSSARDYPKRARFEDLMVGDYLRWVGTVDEGVYIVTRIDPKRPIIDIEFIPKNPREKRRAYKDWGFNNALANCWLCTAEGEPVE
jgi:hypothetical protein